MIRSAPAWRDSSAQPSANHVPECDAGSEFQGVVHQSVTGSGDTVSTREAARDSAVHEIMQVASSHLRDGREAPETLADVRIPHRDTEANQAPGWSMERYQEMNPGPAKTTITVAAARKVPKAILA